MSSVQLSKGRGESRVHDGTNLLGRQPIAADSTLCADPFGVPPRYPEMPVKIPGEALLAHGRVQVPVAALLTPERHGVLNERCCARPIARNVGVPQVDREVLAVVLICGEGVRVRFPRFEPRSGVRSRLRC